MPIDKENHNIAEHRIACVRRGCDQTRLVPEDEALPDQWVEAQGWIIAQHHRTRQRTYRVLRSPHGPKQLNVDEFRHNCEYERRATSLFVSYAVPTGPGKVHVLMRRLVQEAQDLNLVSILRVLLMERQ